MELLRLLPTSLRQEIKASTGDRKMYITTELECYFNLEQIPEPREYTPDELNDALAVLRAFLLANSYSDESSDCGGAGGAPPAQYTYETTEDLQVAQLSGGNRVGAVQDCDAEIAAWRLDEAEYSAARLEDERAALERRLAACGERNERLAQENEHTNGLLVVCKGQNVELTQQIRQMEEKMVYLTQEAKNNEMLGAVVKTFKKYLEELSLEAQTRKGELEDKYQLNHSLETELAGQQARNAALERYLEDQTESSRYAAQNSSNELNKLKAAYKTCYAEKAALEKFCNGQEGLIANQAAMRTMELRSKLQTCEMGKVAAESEISRLEMELSVAKQKNTDLLSQCSYMQFELGQQSQKYDLCQSQIESIKSDKEKLIYSHRNELYLEKEQTLKTNEMITKLKCEFKQVKQDMDKERADYGEQIKHLKEQVYLVDYYREIKSLESCNMELAGKCVDLRRENSELNYYLKYYSDNLNAKLNYVKEYRRLLIYLLGKVADGNSGDNEPSPLQEIRLFFDQYPIGDDPQAYPWEEAKKQFERHISDSQQIAKLKEDFCKACAQTEEAGKLLKQQEEDSYRTLDAANQQTAYLETQISYLQTEIREANYAVQRKHNFMGYMAADLTDLLQFCSNSCQTDVFEAHEIQKRLREYRDELAKFELPYTIIGSISQQLAVCKRYIEEMRRENASLRRETEIELPIENPTVDTIIYYIKRARRALQSCDRLMSENDARISGLQGELCSVYKEYGEEMRLMRYVWATYQDVIKQRDDHAGRIEQLQAQNQQLESQCKAANISIIALQKSMEDALFYSGSRQAQVDALNGRLAVIKRYLQLQLRKTSNLEAEKQHAWDEFRAVSARVEDLQEQVKAVNICQFRHEEQNENLIGQIYQLRTRENTDQIDLLVSSVGESHISNEDVQLQLSRYQQFKPHGMGRPSSSELGLTDMQMCYRDVISGVDGQDELLFEENARLYSLVAQLYAQLQAAQRYKPMNPARGRAQGGDFAGNDYAQCRYNLAAAEQNLSKARAENYKLEQTIVKIQSEAQQKQEELEELQNYLTEKANYCIKLAEEVKEKEKQAENARRSITLDANLKNLADSIIEATMEPPVAGSVEEENRYLRTLLQEKENILYSNSLAYENIDLQHRIYELEAALEMNQQVDDFTVKLKHDQEISGLKTYIARLKKDMNPFVEGMLQNIQDAHAILNEFTDYSDVLADRIKLAIAKTKREADGKAGQLTESRVISQFADMCAYNSRICRYFQDSVDDEDIAESFHLYANYFETVNTILLAPNMHGNDALPKLIRAQSELRQSLIE